jgi:hypothetical protein
VSEVRVVFSLTRKGDLQCEVQGVPLDQWPPVADLVERWVLRRSYGRKLRLLDKYHTNGTGFVAFGDNLVGPVTGPELARRRDEYILVPGFGYCILDGLVADASEEDIRQFLLFSQVYGGKSWKQASVTISYGDCGTCRFLLSSGCVIGNEAEQCQDWVPSQGSKRHTQPDRPDDDSSDS